MNLWYLKCKNIFLKFHIFCVSAIMPMEYQRICNNGLFWTSDPNTPQCTWDPKTLFCEFEAGMIGYFQ